MVSRGLTWFNDICCFGYHIPWYLNLQIHSIWAVAKKSPKYANSPELAALGSAIRERRSAIGMSQESLAHDAGIDRSYMGGIERGEHNVAVVNLLKISTSLGMRLADLVLKAGL